MLAALRKLFGLCSHEWESYAHFVTTSSCHEGFICRKCCKLKWVDRSKQ